MLWSLLTVLLAILASISLGLTLWQWTCQQRFPLHQRNTVTGPFPGVSLLKPLKGCDAETADCLRSWVHQDYPGPQQVLFGAASADDPVCAVVQRLIDEHPDCNAQLVICRQSNGANPKVSTLVQLEALAHHELLILSDADVRAPADLLTQLVLHLQNEQAGLSCCLYSIANPVNLAMRLEAVAVNADFWGQVLQAQAFPRLPFALGAVMATTRQQIRRAGGFPSLARCLADDYELGKRIARGGARLTLCPVVVECWSSPLNWREVWAHQLRWARTIRACQPWPYFLSLLSNATVWPLLLLVVSWAAWPVWPLALSALCLVARIASAADAQRRLTGKPVPPLSLCLPPLKDLLQVGLWALAFLGSRVTWRGERFKLDRQGQLAGHDHL